MRELKTFVTGIALEKAPAARHAEMVQELLARVSRRSQYREANAIGLAGHWFTPNGPPQRAWPVSETMKASGVAANASATETLNDAVAAYDQVVKDLRARLAALSPEQRRAPAFATSDVFTDDPLTFDTGRRIVEANPAFFDPARPSDIQVLTVFNDCVNDECASHEVVAKVIAQLDWSALAAIVR